MDAELRLKLYEAVNASMNWWKKHGTPKYKPGPASPKSAPPSPDSESEALILWLGNMTKRRLSKAADWRQVRDAAAMDLVYQIFRGRLQRGKPPEPAQLPLPGFEHVPRSLGSGKYRVRLPQVPIVRFLKFESRYQARAERNKQTAEELRRIADMVRPYQESDPSMPLAEAMEKAQATSVVVMTPRTAKR